MFFCVNVPFGHHPYDYQELASDVTTAATDTPAPPLAGQLGTKPAKLIPKAVHLTYRSKYLPKPVKELMASWRSKNGNGWQVRFYDDAACMNFVRREFPEYLESYINLPKDVERADFFR